MKERGRGYRRLYYHRSSEQSLPRWVSSISKSLRYFDDGLRWVLPKSRKCPFSCSLKGIALTPPNPKVRKGWFIPKRIIIKAWLWPIWVQKSLQILLFYKIWSTLQLEVWQSSGIMFPWAHIDVIGDLSLEKIIRLSSIVLIMCF